MSQLTIAPANAPDRKEVFDDHAAIAAELAKVGVRFERWAASQPLSENADQEEVLAAYRADIDRLMAENGFTTADVISVGPTHPDRVALREKFLQEHTHSEDEIRFFVDGQGLFMLHIGDKVYGVLCEKGDLISVPDGTPHWFDMGEYPNLKAIRMFTDPSGWVAKFTGSPIADSFDRLMTTKETQG